MSAIDRQALAHAVHQRAERLADDERQQFDAFARLIENEHHPAELARWMMDAADLGRRTNGAEAAGVGRSPSIEFHALSDLRRRVAARGADFLVDGIWPDDAYGVLGAEDKAGKTWAVLDLLVSICTGTAWFARYRCCEGAVLLLLGEGGDRNLLRRLDAICRSRDLDPAVLDAKDRVRVALTVPRLDDAAQLQDVRRQVEQLEPKATLLDPLYLAAGAGRGRDLYAMGEALQAIQVICQQAGSALIVNTHWNQTGEGSGAARFTGVGPSAWGRVLGSAEVEQRQSDPDGRSRVTLRWEFTGGEIADTQFRMRREVWTDDPADLSSPMHYEVEVTEEGIVARTDLSPSQDRVLAALRGRGARTVAEIGDTLAGDSQGLPLKPRTIQKALTALAEKELVDGGGEEGKAGDWWAL
jgi:hypothetical protein